MPALLHIDSLAIGGDGLGRLDGRVVFVPGAAPGDTVEVELLEEKERSARGRIVRLVEPSPDRASPECPHFASCGGCSWMHLKLAAQQEAKAQLFAGALERLGGVARPAFRVNALVPSPQALRYRRRATFHLVGGKLGYRAASSHDLVEIGGCLQLDPRLEEGLAQLRAALAREGPPPRCSDAALACDDRRIAAAFFVEKASRASAERVERLMRAARLDGAVLVPSGNRAQLFGDAVLSSPAACAQGVMLHGRPDLFAQANPSANLLLVGEAMRMLGNADSGEELLELYCGAGNFTFAAVRRGFAVTAIESASESVDLARRSVREASLEGARFIQGDALATAEALVREGRRFAALLLDPPRAGAKGLAPVANRSGARRIVYVSCDPATLARDVRELEAAGFALVEATAVDMFPQTFHLEGVALLERR